MIWIGLFAALVIVAGTLFLARTMRTRAIVLVTGLAAVGAYWMLGRPDLPDEPLSSRLVSLEQLARTSPDQLTGDQIMAIIQKRAHDAPNDPEPHKYMGDLLAAVERPNEAIMAYQSALRRNPDFQPALKALADLSFRMSGEFSAGTTKLYHRAFELDPSDLRLGYMAAIGDWRAGKKAEAETQMAVIEAQTPEGDPRQGMYKALRETFATDTPPSGEPSPAPVQPQR